MVCFKANFFSQDNKVFSYLILSYLILSCLVLSYLIWSYLILSYLILSYLILSYLIWSYLILCNRTGWLAVKHQVTSHCIGLECRTSGLKWGHPNQPMDTASWCEEPGSGDGPGMVNMLLAKEELYNTYTDYLRAQSQGHHTIDRLEIRGVGKRKRSTIFLERRRKGYRQSDERWNCFKRKRWGNFREAVWSTK